MVEILFRLLVAAALIAVGFGGYHLINWALLRRVAKKRLELGVITPGIPVILYFTIPGCIPCKTVQRPALKHLQDLVGSNLQVVEVDAVERSDLADYWGVLTVPTTFIIDSSGEPRHVNQGVTQAEKLLLQLEKIEGRSLVYNEREENKSAKASSGWS